MGEFTADERAAVIASIVGSQALAGVAVTPGEAGALLDGLAGTPLPPIGAAGVGGAMGYSARLVEGTFHIAADRKDAALAAIKALFAPEVIAQRGYHGKYSWVETADALASRTLEDMMEEWGWPVRVDDAGNVVGIAFEAGDSKLGDEDVLWDALTPFVKAGSKLAMAGEDGERWRWFFNGATCARQAARLRYG